MRNGLIPPRAAYVHIPFCARRCGYCNFSVIVGRDDLIGAYLRALEQELSQLSYPREVDTLFLGGGTPSYLQPAWLEQLIQLVRRWFVLAPDYEFSVEANPADFRDDVASVLAAGGVTRVSLGGQSFNPVKLRTLERDHVPQDVVRSVRLAKGQFRSVSLDLIFAAPGESLDAWKADLLAALELPVDHLSTYGLTFERGTTFWSRRARGELVGVDEDRERAMYEMAIDMLTAADFEHYEVSNFARPGHRCRHNETYWAGAGYYAAGPGAARYVDGRRETNHRSTTTWLKRVLAGDSPVAEAEVLDAEDRARERLVFGLRRLEGIHCEAFASATGFSPDALVGPPLEKFVAEGLLDHDGSQLRLTRTGLLVSDSIWPHFLRR